MACMAISSWSWQSQRSDPSTSPVKHCEWIRSNGIPWVRSPMTIASAVSTRRVPFASRSNPMALNMPHLVGMRIDAMRRSALLGAALIVFALVLGILVIPDMVRHIRLRRTLLCFRNGTARAQAVDVGRAEAQLLENLLIVLSKGWGAP